MSKAWSAKRAAKALFREAGTWRMCEEDFHEGYAAALAEVYLIALDEARDATNAPIHGDLAEFARNARTRLTAKPGKPGKGAGKGTRRA